MQHNKLKNPKAVRDGALHSSSKASLRGFTKQSDTALKSHLERLFLRFNRQEFLSSDPIYFAHQYRAAQDQELVGFIAALFSYGSVPQIQSALTNLLKPLGSNPAEMLRQYRGEPLWPGFCYRFHREGHIIALMSAISQALREYGSIEALFTKEHISPSQQSLELLLNQGVERLHGYFESQGLPTDLRRGLKFLISAPKDGSACKRLLMYHRWMVRKDHVDLGLWTSIRPAQLMIPLDTHVARLTYYLGLRESKENTPPLWKMVEEVTTSLRRISPEDPVKYDFALARMGILGLCQKKFSPSICMQCDLVTVCRYSSFNEVLCRI